MDHFVISNKRLRKNLLRRRLFSSRRREGTYPRVKESNLDEEEDKLSSTKSTLEVWIEPEPFCKQNVFQRIYIFFNDGYALWEDNLSCWRVIANEVE